MNSLLRILLALFAINLLAPAPSGAAGIDFVVSKLQARYETINTLSADFSQEVFSVAAGGARSSGGRVHLKKPSMMRWQYLRGIDDEFVSNGKLLWLFQPDLNQVIETAADSTPGIAVDFLSGVGDIRKNFKVSFAGEGGAEESDGAYLLALVPVAASANIKRLMLRVDKSTGLVSETVVEDLFGNRTTVTLSGIEINVPIEDSFFEFVAPEGVNLLKQ